MNKTAFEHPEVPIISVLNRALDALILGVFKIPADSYLNVAWLSRKHCYRLTIDVLPDYWPDGLAAVRDREAEQR